MIRAAMLLIALAASGCDQAERPRFVPASADSAPAPERPSKGGGAVTIPRNIEMH